MKLPEITDAQLNRFLQVATVLCGAFLATTSGLEPPLPSGVLIGFGLLSACLSAFSRSVKTSGRRVSIADVAAWAIGAVVQVVPGGLTAAGVHYGRGWGIAFAVGATAMALLSHGPWSKDAAT